MTVSSLQRAEKVIRVIHYWLSPTTAGMRVISGRDEIQKIGARADKKNMTKHRIN